MTQYMVQVEIDNINMATDDRKTKGEILVRAAFRIQLHSERTRRTMALRNARRRRASGASECRSRLQSL